MSGGGGPSRRSTIQGGGQSINCLSLVESAVINSPDRAVLPTLAVADVLSVELANLGGRDALVALTAQGKRVGSLTPRSLLGFIECIKQGTIYVAIVTDLSSGLCRVDIRPEGIVS